MKTELYTELPKGSTLTYRKINDQAMNRLKADLNHLDWDDVYECSDANSAYENFIAVFQDLYDKPFFCCWKEIKEKKKEALGYKQDTKHDKEKKILYKSVCLTPSISDERNFKSLQNKVIKELRKSRQNYYKDILELNKNYI